MDFSAGDAESGEVVEAPFGMEARDDVVDTAGVFSCCGCYGGEEEMGGVLFPVEPV